MSESLDEYRATPGTTHKRTVFRSPFHTLSATLPLNYIA